MMMMVGYTAIGIDDTMNCSHHQIGGDQYRHQDHHQEWDGDDMNVGWKGWNPHHFDSHPYSET